MSKTENDPMENQIELINIREALIIAGLLILDVVLLFYVARFDMESFHILVMFHIIMVTLSLVAFVIAKRVSKREIRIKPNIMVGMAVALIGFIAIFSLVQSYLSGNIVLYIIELLFIVLLGGAGVLFITYSGKDFKEEEKEWAKAAKGED